MSELPQLAELNEELGDKDVKIIGINVDAIAGDGAGSIAEMVKPILDNANSTMKIIFAEENLVNFIFSRQQAVPYTLFVDSEGNLVGDGYLGAKSKEDWIDIINEEYSKVEQ